MKTESRKIKSLQRDLQHIQSSGGELELIKTHGIPLESNGGIDNNRLHLAAQHGRYELILLAMTLLPAEQIAMQNHYGNNIAHIAAQHNHLTLLEHLRVNRPRLFTIENEDSQTPDQMCCLKKK